MPLSVATCRSPSLPLCAGLRSASLSARGSQEESQSTVPSGTACRAVVAAAGSSAESLREASAALRQRSLVALRTCAELASSALTNFLTMAHAVRSVLQSAPRWAVFACVLCLLAVQMLLVGAFLVASQACLDDSAVPNAVVQRRKMAFLCAMVFVAGGVLGILRDHPLCSVIMVVV